MRDPSEIWTGKASSYDRARPTTPPALLDRLAQEGSLRLVELVRERGLAQSLKIWPKNKSLDPLRESGHFRFTREVLLHHIEQGDTARFLEIMQSSALSHQFQFTEQEIGF